MVLIVMETVLWCLVVFGLAAIAIAGVLPSQVVADKENTRLGISQGTPYARTPASAQSVDNRIVFGDLGDQAEQYPPEGDIYFVTVTEPAQSVLSWVLGRDNPAVQFLTTEEKFGVQTPQQRRTFARQALCDRQADAAGRAGDDGDLAGEVLHQGWS